VFWASSGIWRWHCHGCGAGGTAIDLMMHTRGLTVSAAFVDLRHRLGAAASAVQTRPRTRAIRAASAAWARPAMLRFVRACEAQLWSARGAPGRAWLSARRLDEPVLRANHVGYDPGPAHLPRPRGLPGRGPAVVWTVSDHHGPRYVQLRYLDPNTTERKYDNPAAWFATNPRYATMHPTDGADVSSAPVFVCEGIPDALSITQAGGNALALLGVGLADRGTAQWLHEHHPERRIVIAFDADSRGRRATRELGGWLEDLEHPVDDLELPPTMSDVNDWLRGDATALKGAVTAHIKDSGVEVPSLEL
jgi:DNA primase